MFTYSYTVLWFLYTLFTVCKQSSQINITILVFELNIWAKTWVFSKQGCQKRGPFIITMVKNWVSHILFLRKRGLIVYLAGLVKVGYSGRTTKLCHIKIVTPPPPSVREGRASCFALIVVFLLCSCLCSVSLPHGNLDFSVAFGCTSTVVPTKCDSDVIFVYKC